MHEGWGMTKLNEDVIIATDSSHKLFHINPEDFTVIKTVEVKRNGYSLKSLNELEIIDGKLYANIFLQNNIAHIDPNTGEVLDFLNF